MELELTKAIKNNIQRTAINKMPKSKKQQQ